MELILNIVLGAVLILLLFRMWPVYKAWQEHGPKAQAGDWQAAVFALGLVVGLVVLLVAMVR